MPETIRPGDVVTPTEWLEDGDGENTPRGTVARPGEALVVVAVDGFWPLYVKHPPVSYPVGERYTFGVRLDEVAPLRDTCKPPSFPADLFKAAGRELDRRTHDGFPEPAPA